MELIFIPLHKIVMVIYWLQLIYKANENLKNATVDKSTSHTVAFLICKGVEEMQTSLFESQGDKMRNKPLSL